MCHFKSQLATNCSILFYLLMNSKVLCFLLESIYLYWIRVFKKRYFDTYLLTILETRVISCIYLCTLSKITASLSLFLHHGLSYWIVSGLVLSSAILLLQLSLQHNASNLRYDLWRPQSDPLMATISALLPTINQVYLTF